ncbi:FecR family protein [Aureimonas sp. ME7]|uniref:FecR family protein n=1 Tax=Aureimonas sp. ME7 TaxID=2744252 RepID=UPI001FCE4343|nr:FecR family protein [Aureimonas sp. ME7]
MNDTREPDPTMEGSQTDKRFEEALEWFVRLREEDAEPDLRARFETWRLADPRNEEAFARAQALWDGFEIARPSFRRRRRGPRLDRRGVLTLGGLLALGGPALYWASRPGRFADYRTDVAERRSVTLADGSEVELASYSALSVDFTPTQRGLTLHRGQAFFRVAPDADRPFVVEAGAGRVRALGTAFDLKLVAGNTTVSVMEHAVEIAAAKHTTTLEAGWQASYGTGGIAPPQRFDAGVAEAWRRDRIVFEDVPLRRVLAELERYRHGPILLMGANVGEIPVTAVFDTRDTDQALRTIERNVPVRVVAAAGFVTLVYAR